jgi:hypothetical protein
MLSVVRAMLSKADDAASLQQRIDALKREGAEACVEIERLERSRALSENYETAIAVDEKVKRQKWVVDHVDATLPGLEKELAAVRVVNAAAALARHRSNMQALFPKLKKALEAAARLQQEAIAIRDAAAAELGNAAVEVNLPRLVYLGFLLDPLIQIWVAEQSKLWSPKAAPAPVALPAPAKPVAVLPPKSNAIAGPPAPTARPIPRRRPLRDDEPADGETLVQVLRAGVELPDGTQAYVGDRLALAATEANILILRGAATAVAGEGKTGDVGNV